jgi:hypothetical protein
MPLMHCQQSLPWVPPAVRLSFTACVLCCYMCARWPQGSADAAGSSYAKCQKLRLHKEL